ncbi:response regulator [Bradyrhizobium sp. WSM 1738]|uniref:response regulator transcription factor n=1 Tax=Bradyrhizobium hereditatis TaxID=2821405 RepID=UPI001CE385A9|nr:response regulator [Bradyrhizobium hereditatis]MCA6116906.1 response regulator [Bradyrhizobium hereditatis]
MMALIVEDDDNKREQLLSFLNERYPRLELKESASLIAAVRALKQLKPHLVILDMTLPNYDVVEGESGGGLHPFGGQEFLRQVSRFKIMTSVIVLTQFESFGEPPDAKGLEELDGELRENFPNTYKGAVYYHASIYDWTTALANTIETSVPEILTCR